MKNLALEIMWWIFIFCGLFLGLFFLGSRIQGCISTSNKASNASYESIKIRSGGNYGRIEKILIDGCQYLVLMGPKKGGIIAAVNQPVTCKRWNNLDIEK